jgi:two-component system LytT family sensor kinase
VTSELSLLKAQINPYFFYNTVNNIYVLTQIDANVAGQAIYQLSRMMRYLLYETSQGQSRLSQEISFVKDYISIMELRLADMVKLDVDIPSSLLDTPMAPMLLLPFLENAFKHGVSTTHCSYIDIVIRQLGSTLDFTVRNSIIKDMGVNRDTSSGIGLVNTRRRLELLYQGRYKLEICKSIDNSVHLMLDLS